MDLPCLILVINFLIIFYMEQLVYTNDDVDNNP